jgi:hypothetical protein
MSSHDGAVGRVPRDPVVASHGDGTENACLPSVATLIFCNLRKIQAPPPTQDIYLGIDSHGRIPSGQQINLLLCATLAPVGGVAVSGAGPPPQRRRTASPTTACYRLKFFGRGRPRKSAHCQHLLVVSGGQNVSAWVARSRSSGFRIWQY